MRVESAVHVACEWVICVSLLGDFSGCHEERDEIMSEVSEVSVMRNGVEWVNESNVRI